MRLFRTLAFLLFVLVLAANRCHAARYASANFLVDAATADVAQQVGDCAEKARKEEALQWLGREMPRWSEPCPLKVTVQSGGAGGATSFAFDGGRVVRQDCHVEGPLPKLLSCVVPHEVTHTVLAWYFRRPLPRWADEGAAVSSEDEAEQLRHDKLCRDVLNGGRMIPLASLLPMQEYPKDVMCLYAEGSSVTNYLLLQGGKQRFLALVAEGMNGGWDNAIRRVYNLEGVQGLEKAWLDHMRATKGAPVLASAVATPASTSPVTAPASPPSVSGVSVTTTPPSDPIMAALAKIDRKLDALPQIQAQLSDHEKRLRAVEQALGWSQQPQRQVSAPLPNAQPLGSYQFAQPMPFGQPGCPPGGH